MKGKINQEKIEKELNLIFQNLQFISSEKEKKLLAYLVKRLLPENILRKHILQLMYLIKMVISTRR